MPRPLAFLGLLGLFALIALGVVAVPDRDAAADGPAAGPTVTGVPPATAVPLPATTSFRFPAGDDEARAGSADAAPVQLTATDGTGLALVAFEANAVLEPPLAFTELHLTFDNPRDETIEGRFRIALPPGAALSRFAMKIGDRWQEGEVVERQRARQAYEDFLHRRQDPALLEQEAGNEFSARVFPIPARGRKELIVSYSQALARASEPYVLPLQGLSRIGRLDVRVLLGERPAEPTKADDGGLGGELRDRRVFELHKRDWTPDRDVALGQDRLAERAGLRHGNLAVARLAAPVEAAPQEIAGLYVLVDSSASRALGYAAQARRLGELIAGLQAGAGAATPLGVAAFDQEVVSIYEGRAGGFGAEQARRLAEPPAARRLRPPRRARLARRAPGRRAGDAARAARSPTASPPPATPRPRPSRRRCGPSASRGVERLDVLGGRRPARRRGAAPAGHRQPGPRRPAPGRRARRSPRSPAGSPWPAALASRSRSTARPGSGRRPSTASSRATRCWSTPTCRRAAPLRLVGGRQGAAARQPDSPRPSGRCSSGPGCRPSIDRLLPAARHRARRRRRPAPGAGERGDRALRPATAC